ncbi:hypothetical protein [Allopusillimonas soli]|uniref:BssS family protein n=1 Tax=Allopusillimonas soli TaxID=659016 RepID=A0A853F7S0_9BURK|nr:hypothetical protein [Allopusillimonas soli]NYT36645.1 hypothetical protein [Allopusillimonas soli]
MDEKIPIFPVTAWTVGPVPRLGFAVMKFDFIASPKQKIEEASEGPNFALTATQLRDLIQQMREALDVLESTDDSATDENRDP